MVYGKKIFVTTRFLISLTNFSGSQIKAQLQYIYIYSYFKILNWYLFDICNSYNCRVKSYHCFAYFRGSEEIFERWP